jgi:hypothetical protein
VPSSSTLSLRRASLMAPIKQWWLLGDEMKNDQAKVAMRKKVAKPGTAAAMMTIVSIVADGFPNVVAGEASAMAGVEVIVGHSISE